jgi:hypothetical protein
VHVSALTDNASDEGPYGLLSVLRVSGPPRTKLQKG